MKQRNAFDYNIFKKQGIYLLLDAGISHKKTSVRVQLLIPSPTPINVLSAHEVEAMEVVTFKIWRRPR